MREGLQRKPRSQIKCGWRNTINAKLNNQFYFGNCGARRCSVKPDPSSEGHAFMRARNQEPGAKRKEQHVLIDEEDLL